MLPTPDTAIGGPKQAKNQSSKNMVGVPDGLGTRCGYVWGDGAPEQGRGVWGGGSLPGLRYGMCPNPYISLPKQKLA